MIEIHPESLESAHVKGAKVTTRAKVSRARRHTIVRTTPWVAVVKYASASVGNRLSMIQVVVSEWTPEKGAQMLSRSVVGGQLEEVTAACE